MRRPGFEFEARAAAVQPDDVLTLIYTSGTTGPPKGVQITHRNVMSLLASLSDRLGPPGRDPRDLVAADGARGRAAVRPTTSRSPTAGASSPVRPEGHRRRSSPRSVPSSSSRRRGCGRSCAPACWPRVAIVPQGAAAAAALQAIGFDALRVAIVGAAPCPPEVVRFWHALGVRLCEVYGMSETTGVVTVNPPDAVRIGTVGPPLPGVEVRLGEAGEVLVRGANVMRGYRNLPEKTAEALDPEGWLHTGDVGTFDDAGYLQIVDRIKEMIISAAGKNMSPANIEAELKTAGAADRPGLLHRRRPALQRRAHHPRPGRGRRVRGRARHRARRRGHRRRRPRGGRGRGRGGQHRLARVEQISKFTILPEDWVARRRRADADDEAQARGDRGEVRAGDRGHVCRLTRGPRSAPRST